MQIHNKGWFFAGILLLVLIITQVGEQEPEPLVETKTITVTRNIEVPVPGPTVTAANEAGPCKQLAPMSQRVYQLVEQESAIRGELNLLLKQISKARQLDDQAQINKYMKTLDDLTSEGSQNDQDIVEANSDLAAQIKKCEG